jgi:hypothetical protein
MVLLILIKNAQKVGIVRNVKDVGLREEVLLQVHVHKDGVH